MEINNEWQLIFSNASPKEAQRINQYLRYCCLLCGRHYGNFQFPEKELWKSSEAIDDQKILYITNSCTDLSMLKLGNQQVRELLKKLRKKLQKVKNLEEAMKVLGKHRKKVAKLKEKHGVAHGIYISKPPAKEEKKSNKISGRISSLKSLRKSTGALTPLEIVELPLVDSSADTISLGTITEDTSREDTPCDSFLSLPGETTFSESFIKKKLESPKGRPRALIRSKSTDE